MGLSPQQPRTRAAILEAAAAEWARDPSATVGDVARTAKVGRATVHRYFADRADLRSALISDSWQSLRQAIGEAALGTGSVLQAMDRLVGAMVHVGDRLMFLFSSTEGNPAARDASAAAAVDRAMLAEIKRGQRTGELDATVPAEWIERIVWSLVYTGLHAAREGLVARHGVDALVRRTLRGAISSR